MRGPDITALLARAGGGDQAAENLLYEIVYMNLLKRARLLLQGQADPSWLGPGTVVHETFEKLFRSGTNIEFQNRAHFYFIATKAMRHLIVDHARSRDAGMRGGGQPLLPLEEIDVPGMVTESREDVIAIDQACTRLAATKPALAQVVQLRFFGGLTTSEMADILDVSHTTIERRWRLAKAFLHRELTGEEANHHATQE